MSHSYHKADYFCMYIRASIDRMRAAVQECGLFQWPDNVDIELGDEDCDFPAQVNFEPSRAGGLTMPQFMQIAAAVLRLAKHEGHYDFGIHANSGNPRFFYPGETRAGKPEGYGGFYVDENKVQGEAVMRLNKIREIVG